MTVTSPAPETHPTPENLTRPASRRPAVAVLAVAGAVVLAVLLWVAERNVIWWMADWRVYQVAVEAIWQGDGRLYDVTAPPLSDELQFGAPFNYPPFAALLLAPLALLPWDLLSIVWGAGKILALTVVVWRCLAAAGVQRRRVALTAAAVLGFQLVDPIFTDLQVGNVNIFILLLVVVDLTRRPGARWRGALVGLAAAIKITPGLFIVYLLVTRQFRAAVTAVAAFTATVAVGAVVLPRDSWRYWTSVMFQPERVFTAEFTHNQSIRGAVARLLGTVDNPVPWLLLAAVVTVGGLVLAVGLHRRGDELAALVVCGVVTVLVSPFSWNHHWIWVVPAVVLMWTVAARTRSAGWWAALVVTLLMFLLRPYLFASFDPTRGFGLSPLSQLLAASYVFAGLGLLGWAEAYRRRLPTVAPPPTKEALP